MRTRELHKLKYPIGPYRKPALISDQLTEQWIDTIAEFPTTMHDLTSNLTAEQLNFIYRPDGWKVKQVVHHCADSHMNFLIRIKLALTEDTPTIRPYFEDRWALLSDALDDDLSNTLNLLKYLHAKIVGLLRSLSAEQLQRSFIHPDSGKEFSMAEVIGHYAWHSNHHIAHVRQALQLRNDFSMR